MIKYFSLEGMDRKLLASLVIFHTLIIALSNFLVTIPFEIYGFKLTWAAFTFPLVVVATDLTVRLINAQNARAVVNLAFVPAILVSIAVVYAGGAPESVALRIGVASASAYLVSSLMDVFVFQKIRERFAAWYLAPGVSAIFANIVDTFTFFAVAFYESANPYMAENWPSVAAGQTASKVLVSLLVILPIYGMLLTYLNRKFDRVMTTVVKD